MPSRGMYQSTIYIHVHVLLPAGTWTCSVPRFLSSRQTWSIVPFRSQSRQWVLLESSKKVVAEHAPRDKSAVILSRPNPALLSADPEGSEDGKRFGVAKVDGREGSSLGRTEAKLEHRL